MGQIETAGAGRADAPPAAALQRCREDRARRRPVLAPLPRRRRCARRPVHVPARGRPFPDGHQRRQPRARPGLVSRPLRPASRSGSTDRLADYAMLAVQGPESPRDRRRARRRRVAAADAHRDLPLAAGPRRRRGARLRHRLHGRGRRRGPYRAGGRGRAVGRRCSDRGATPAGLGARDTLRLEVCFHLYGNDLSEDRNPIEAGLGWCCVEATGFIGVRGGRRGARAAGRSRSGWRRSRSPGPDPAPGKPGARRSARRPARVTSGTPSPSARTRDRDGLRARRARRPGTEVEIDVRGRSESGEGREAPAAGTRRRD